jgi:hypothetical protein
MNWAELERQVASAMGPARGGPALSWMEGRRLLDRRARRHLGISGDEFIRRWYAGLYGEEPGEIEVAYVSMLLPYAR